MQRSKECQCMSNKVRVERYIRPMSYRSQKGKYIRWNHKKGQQYDRYYWYLIDRKRLNENK